MAHGTPDWAVTSGARTVFQLTDLAEHAVRLGSIDSYERAGDVLALEDFENGLGGVEALYFAEDARVELTTAVRRSGLFGVRMVGAADGLSASSITKAVPFAGRSNFGVEVSFYLGGGIGYLYWILSLLDGANESAYQVRWDDLNERLEYYNEIYGWTAFATGVDLAEGAALFHTAKLVLASEETEYLRFRLDDTTYSLAGVAAAQVANPALPLLAASVWLYGRAGANNSVVVDDLIITQNEPA